MHQHQADDYLEKLRKLKEELEQIRKDCERFPPAPGAIETKEELLLRFLNLTPISEIKAQQLHDLKVRYEQVNQEKMKYVEDKHYEGAARMRDREKQLLREIEALLLKSE